jgi:multidrug efflux system membrane fusion protein
LPAVLLAACGSKQPTTVTADDGSNRSEYSGEARARYESTVGFRIAGGISQRLVEVGSRVRRNQPIAKLDAIDTELNVGSARAQRLPPVSVRSRGRCRRRCTYNDVGTPTTV